MLLILLSAALVAAMTRLGTLDKPGARSSHTRPTPKGGGVGIVAAFAVGVLWHGMDARALGLVAAVVGIAAVSYADDLRSFSFAPKLGAQVLATLLVMLCGIRLQVVQVPGAGAVDLGWVGAPLTLAWFLFTTNAVNFIDGLNGLASGTVAIACLVLAGAIQDGGFVCAAALSLAAGIGGFLPFNYPRARIFMGDVGSQACGFGVAALGVLAAGMGMGTQLVLLVPMMLFAVLFDVAFTLVRRAIAGDRLTQAHRGHLYQLAHRSGMTAWQVTLIYWAMAAGAGLIVLKVRDTAIAVTLAAMLPAAWLGYVLVKVRSIDIGRW